jgi:hypothetical protein
MGTEADITFPNATIVWRLRGPRPAESRINV